MTEDLIIWLRAQLDVDASNTEAAIAGTLEELRRDGCSTTREELLAVDRALARRLREVEAKRLLLGDDSDGAAVYAVHERGYWPDELTRFADDVLRLLALPYSDRPGFRQEWAPDG